MELQGPCFYHTFSDNVFSASALKLVDRGLCPQLPTKTLKMCFFIFFLYLDMLFPWGHGFFKGWQSQPLTQPDTYFFKFLSRAFERLNIIPLTGEGGSLLFVICHLLANCSCLKHSLRNLFGILNIFLKDGSFRTMEFTLFLQIYV